MKKIVIVAIFAIYLVSIVVVNFFGLEITIFEGTTYAEKVEFEGLVLHKPDGTERWFFPEHADPNYKDPNGVPLFVIPFTPAPEGSEYTAEEESLLGNPNAVEIRYRVKPDNADNKNVQFLYDEAAVAGNVVFREGIKSLVFLNPNKIITLTLVTSDGTNKKVTIKVMAQIAE